MVIELRRNWSKVKSIFIVVRTVQRRAALLVKPIWMFRGPGGLLARHDSSVDEKERISGCSDHNAACEHGSNPRENRAVFDPDLY